MPAEVPRSPSARSPRAGGGGPGLFAFGILAGIVALGLGFFVKIQIVQAKVRGLLALIGIWGGSAVEGLTQLFAFTTPVTEPNLAPVTSWPVLGERTRSVLPATLTVR